MKKKKQHLILKSFLILFAIYASVNIFSLRAKIADKQRELDAINEQMYSQQITNQQLAESAGKPLTDDEIADIAREKLGYALPGERVFINITGK